MFPVFQWILSCRGSVLSFDKNILPVVFHFRVSTGKKEMVCIVDQERN